MQVNVTPLDDISTLLISYPVPSLNDNDSSVESHLSHSSHSPTPSIRCSDKTIGKDDLEESKLLTKDSTSCANSDKSVDENISSSTLR